jgi:acyl-CoA reductase-like NAD-dependent aldehyde dehydrogenase
MSLERRNYIAGEWVTGNTEISNINPSDTNDVIGHYAQASAAQLDDALASARLAQPLWERTALEQRQSVLMAIGQELMARSEELGQLLSREEGKTLAEGKGEIYRSGQFFTYFAAEVLRQMGDNADSVREGVEVDVRREAVGVVAIISPWNFPTATAAWKIAPALAFGNAVVWKPANLVPASAVALAEIISRQGMPAGTFNLVMGAGIDIGQRLIESVLLNNFAKTSPMWLWPQPQGDEVPCGGQVLERATPGFYMAPTLVVGTDNRASVNQGSCSPPWRV